MNFQLLGNVLNLIRRSCFIFFTLLLLDPAKASTLSVHYKPAFCVLKSSAPINSSVLMDGSTDYSISGCFNNPNNTFYTLSFSGFKNPGLIIANNKIVTNKTPLTTGIYPITIMAIMATNSESSCSIKFYLKIIDSFVLTIPSNNLPIPISISGTVPSGTVLLPNVAHYFSDSNNRYTFSPDDFLVDDAGHLKTKNSVSSGTYTLTATNKSGLVASLSFQLNSVAGSTLAAVTQSAQSVKLGQSLRINSLGACFSPNSSGCSDISYTIDIKKSDDSAISFANNVYIIQSNKPIAFVDGTSAPIYDGASPVDVIVSLIGSYKAVIKVGGVLVTLPFSVVDSPAVKSTKTVITLPSMSDTATSSTLIQDLSAYFNCATTYSIESGGNVLFH